MPMIEPLQKNALRKPWLRVGTRDRRHRGWVRWCIRTRKLTMRTWRVGSGRDCRICPPPPYTRNEDHIMLNRLLVSVVVLGSVAKPLRATDLPQWKIPCLRLIKPVYLPCGMLALFFSFTQKLDATPGETLPQLTLTRGSVARRCKPDRHFPFNTSLDRRPCRPLLL